MKKISLLLAVLIITAALFTGCGSSDQTKEIEKTETAEITVLAAASLTDSLDEIIKEYNKNSTDKIKTSYAGSGDLVQQIKGGAPWDLFISASKSNMDELQEEGLIDEESREDLLGNTLTLVASKEKADKVTRDALTTDAVESIAIGEEETVPAGKYAMQVLDKLKITSKVKDKIVKAKDVKAVLNYVDTGNADCGFVYKTDAMLADSAKIIADVDANLHDPIVYPAAMMKDSKQAEATANFYKYLQDDFAKQTFEKYGFVVK